MRTAISILFLLTFFCNISFAQNIGSLTTIDENGWANNSVNTVIFRKNSLATYKNVQYAAYYDTDSYVVLAKRETGSKRWTVGRTAYKGDATDAHKSISIIVDGAGFLHVAWGQHNNNLNYARGKSPGSLILNEKSAMLSVKESKVSYPEFYKLENGDILFLYRDGGSGNGNLMLNRYDVKKQIWSRVQDGLIDGEGLRNAYWQMAIDAHGTIHLSWVWRESPDVASNHDMCYAKSADGGKTWQRSTGESYILPITAANAEYAYKIPQKSELINQTSMFANDKGDVFIASYWRNEGETVPQYHLIYKDAGQWKASDLGFRKTAFSLSGGGTKRIPISRPQIIAWPNGNKQAVALVFRDLERGNKVSIAVNENINNDTWKLTDLTNTEVGDWEPTYDTELWKKRQILNLFIQKVTQIDGEGKADVGASPVQVLEWSPKIKVVAQDLSSFKKDKKLLIEIDQNFANSAAQYKVLTKNLPSDRFPKTYHPKTSKFETSGSGWWCSGFYPGTLLYLYQQTHDLALLAESDRILKVLEKEQYNKTTHDLGFMMYCSFGNALEISPKQKYKEILINSAQSLASRFDPKVGCIKSWDSKKPEYLVIIDNMMNLELLFWATKETGDSSFYKIAVTHANTTMKNHFRSDFSSYHVVDYNPETGEVQKRRTAQGYADESAWARGQAWGLYGYTVMYRETRDQKYLDQANHIAKFMLDHPNLPKDKVPYWDFNAPDLPNALRDASAAAVMASALLELSKYTDRVSAKKDFKVAETIIKTLSSSIYTAKPGENGGFILMHSVGNIPEKTEVDVPLTYADYYFVEAMKRYKEFNLDNTSIK